MNLKSSLFIKLGIICISLALILTSYNLYSDYHAGYESEKVYQKLLDNINHVDNWGKDVDPNMSMPIKMIDGNEYIGILEIPDLNLSLPIMNDWSYEKLKIAPCRYSGSLYLNNMVIAGHNYTKHFNKIKSLPYNTALSFTDVEGRTYHYIISNIEILKPNQVEQLTKSSDEWNLTLFTCTYLGRTRAVIRCVLTTENSY